MISNSFFRFRSYFLILIITFITATYPVVSQELVTSKKPASNKIVLKFMFRNGSISDPEGKEGLTALTASLVTEGGTATLTKAEIDEKIYPMAAQYGSSVDKEVSVFTFEVHKDFLNEFYEIAKGLMLTPSFTDQDFKRVLSNQQNYVDQVIRASSDEEYSKKALEDLLFRGTNYQHMVSGTSDGLKAISLDDVKNHYKSFFTKDNLMIGIAGNYDQSFIDLVKKDMSSLPALTATLPTPGKARVPDGIHVEIISKENALGSAIFTGAPLNMTRANDDFAALMVANSWLGEHRKSYGKLYQKLRGTRSMNYGDYSYIEWYDRGGSFQLPLPGVPRKSNYFSLWIRPVQIGEQLRDQYPELKDINVGHAHFALRMVIREVDQLAKNGLSKEDFELTKTFLRSYIKLYTQTPAQELGFLMDSKFYGRENYIEELDDLLNKVTLEDVNQAVKKYLQPDNMFVVIVTDDSEAEPLAESLRKNSLSPMSYSNLVKEGLPQEVLKEDEEVAGYKLNIKSVKVIDDKESFNQPL